MPWFLTGLFTLASTLSETFADTKLWTWNDAESSCDAPRQTPWIHSHEMGRRTMQVISNGGLLLSSWPSLSNVLKGGRLTDWPAPVPMRLTYRTVQVISNGDILCFRNKRSCRRSFDASSQSVAFGEHSSLSGFDHTKPARSQVRGDVVNHTIPNKKQRTHYSWCEGWWPIRWVIGKQPLSSAMNMTRAEALRTDSYAVRGTIQKHRLNSTPCGPLLGHTFSFSCVPFSGHRCFLCVPISGHRCFLIIPGHNTCPTSIFQLSAACCPLRAWDHAPLTGSPNWCCRCIGHCVSGWLIAHECPSSECGDMLLTHPCGLALIHKASARTAMGPRPMC